MKMEISEIPEISGTRLQAMDFISHNNGLFFSFQKMPECSRMTVRLQAHTVRGSI
ncbi:hypothetical protein [Comamonas testosteroni]|uniref:hypothetical protein n=1 Tax=Comamonas testosteroni TaxID=285 RepID=UPI000A602757|nr:hypothetical protein [Comamonas testosteroni]QQN69981.1 hypothetical protein IYN88_00695 [Comamonas testosteroni]